MTYDRLFRDALVLIYFALLEGALLSLVIHKFGHWYREGPGVNPDARNVANDMCLTVSFRNF